MFTFKKFGVLVGMLGAMGIAGSASAAVDGSLHDLASGTEEICIYCHTPHNANSQGSPLWNRTNSLENNYALYTSDTLDELATQPVGVSQACLSCHDGTVAFNSLTNVGDAVNADSIGDVGYQTTTPITSLANQHPISITLPVDAGEFKTAAVINAVVGGAVIYGDQVECGSCHDPHAGASVANFLRVDNASSALCLSCHTK